jgi:hypothetical protein
VLVQEGSITCSSFTPCYNDVVRDVLVFVKEGKLTHTSFYPQWNDVIQDVLVPLQD